MRVIIVEDEYAAARNLVAILHDIDADIEVLTILESVKELHRWLLNNPPPDLGFFDIQLSDSSVFDIFKLININFPIIFTTAFSQFAIDAFKVHSIDYILKPLSVDTVRFAINKFRSLEKFNGNISERKLREIMKELNQSEEPTYKKSFLVRVKDRLIPVETQSFAFFYIDSGTVHGVTNTNSKYLLEYTLEELENQLDPYFFQRVNRQYIVNRKSIKEIALHFHSRYSLKVIPTSADKIIMSKLKSSQIRKWLES